MQTPSSLRELFEQAALLSPEQRTAFIATCPDAAMRERLGRMFEADASDVDAIALNDASAVADLLGDLDYGHDLPAGTRIGPFELIAVLGEGGSSTVFRAAREAQGVRQEVALKLLRRGLYSPDAQRQFRRERMALAQLQHPGIARLIEGGVTDSGLAYIALDLVEGQTITDYAREQRLDLRQRLRLFLQVCRAVEAAHHALIVHRDLKPSNVLVTSSGEVKLLDFGIAKLLDAEDDTQTRVPAFTPAYAAPEQRSGGPITTATDVYALGILLGELVTGERLNDGTGRTPSGQISDHCEPGVLPATPKVTRRQLRGDLDNVVLKAIATEPERRYASASALADDMERLLSGHPVIAHPPSRLYRARKFIVRHKGGVLTTVAFVLAIFAALGFALWQAKLARYEAHRANEQATRAEQVKTTLVGLFSGLDPSVTPEKRPTLEQIFESGVTDMRADATIEPGLRVELMSIAGHVLFRIGHRQRGLDLAGEAVAFSEAHLPADAEAYLSAVATLSHLDFLDGRLEAANTRLQAAFARAGAGNVASSARMEILSQLGSIARSRGELKQAVGDLEMAKAMHDRLTPNQLDDAAFTIRGELASTYFQMSHFEQAASLQRELLEQSRKRYGNEDEASARFMGDLADSLDKLGHWDEAMSLLKSSAESLRRSLPAPNESFALWLYSIGRVQAEQQLWPSAEKMFAESDTTMIGRFGANEPLAFGPRVALADSRTQLGRPEEARAELEKMLAVQLAHPKPSPRITAMLHLALGRTSLKFNQPDVARNHANEALAIHRKLYGVDDSHNLEPLMLLSRSAAALAKPDDAVAAAYEAEQIAANTFTAGNSARIRIALLLGDLTRRDPTQSTAHYRAALEEAAAAPERPLALLVETHRDLAELASSSGSSDEAKHEREITEALRAELEATQRDSAKALDTWLAQGPAYK